MHEDYFLICGLGNPGLQYIRNRHNVGFMTVDKMVHRFNFSSYQKKFNGDFFSTKLDSKKVIFFRPTNFMNRSGIAVSEVIRFYKIPLSNVFVIHDDLDIEIGKIRLKIGGGSGGHNGIKSLDAHIGNNYYRVRVGISHPGIKEMVSSYVLSDFSAPESKEVERVSSSVAENIELLLDRKIEEFINHINSNS
jgi:peptidyl-tRNA hydrolase, PTH1 family